MKKAFFALLLLLLLVTGLVFILIPTKIAVVNACAIQANRNGFNSCLHNLNKWEQWWPYHEKTIIGNSVKDSLFGYRNIQYKFEKAVNDGAEIQIKRANKSISSKILVLPRASDSLLAQWTVILDAGNNPVSRLKTYLIAKELKESTRSLLDSLCLWGSKIENLYDFPIIRTTFLDTILVTYRLITPGYPNVNQVYNSIKEIRKYIASQNAGEKDYPMLNTKKLDDGQYETMIAICINKKISDSKEFEVVRMVNMKDKFLSTEVIGGPLRINNAHAAILRYMDDRKLSAPGRPFEIMITDRSKEPDTSKWKTIVYHPSM